MADAAPDSRPGLMNAAATRLDLDRSIALVRPQLSFARTHLKPPKARVARNR